MEENKINLDQEIRRSRERKQNLKNLPINIIKPVKKTLMNVDGEFEINRLSYIDRLMNALIMSNKYSFKVLEIIKRTLVEYNISLTKYLEEVEKDDDLCYYVAVLIYKMIDSGLFNEEDYLEVKDYEMKTPLQLEKKWSELLKSRNENKRKDI